MKITVSVPPSTFTLEVQSSDKISAIAAQIEQKTGVQPGDCVLLLNSQKLEDDKTIGDYGIQEETVLEGIVPEICDFEF